MHNRSKWKRATWKGLNNAFLVLVFQVDGPTTGGACTGVGGGGGACKRNFMLSG